MLDLAEHELALDINTQVLALLHNRCVIYKSIIQANIVYPLWER